MRRIAIVLALSVCPVLFAADLPRYWSVHIDQPAERASFERIDKQDAETRREFYASRNIVMPAVWRIVAADGTHLGLRPRGATLADFDKSPLTPEQMKELQSRTNPLSDAIHKTLRTHHSEIWSVQKELTTFAGEPRKYVAMRVDVVAPPNDDAYDEAMKKLVAELAANGVETVAFFSSYGDGAYHYLFTSEKPIKVRKLGALAKTRDVAATLEIR
jgi:hypothetical protein